MSYPRVSMVEGASSMATLSVISSRRPRGSRPVSNRAREMSSTSPGVRDWLAERLTLIVRGGCVGWRFRHYFACRQVSRSTHRPIGVISSVSSATRTNPAGETRPLRGCSHLSNASIPTMTRSSIETIGW